ncbi:MAG: 6-pyruvoyl tetrahydropterin synthase family protein [Candidatus Hydrothermarchaeales archaeon]
MYGLVIDDPRLRFSASHFIVEHEKCEKIHGHNYGVKVELRGNLDKRRMVVDFREIKDVIIGVVNRLDHKLLLPAEKGTVKIREGERQIEVTTPTKFYSIPKEDYLLLPIKSTTAEDLARYIFDEVKKHVPLVTKVYVSETDGSAAFYEEG